MSSLDRAANVILTVARDEEFRSVVEAVGRAKEMGDAYLARQRRGEGLLVVAWRGREPLGHAFVSWSGRAAVVEGLIVAAPHRSQGIGTALLAWAEAEARRRGCSALGLGVEADSNPRAHALYLRLGFAPRTACVDAPEEAVDRRCTQLWKVL